MSAPDRAHAERLEAQWQADQSAATARAQARAEQTEASARIGRPPLIRHAVTISLTVEVGAEDREDAYARALALLTDVEPRIAATIRAHRIGAPSLTTAQVRRASIGARP